MDIAAFICEQLEHRSIVNVPGLGSFYRSRVDGYYNKDQQQFYPPSIQIHFSGKLQDDDTLTTLLSTEKRISQASASYFIEKFVTNLKEQASTTNVPLGKFGVFSMSKNGLSFTPKRRSETNELFYGLTPVKLKKHSPYRQLEETVIPTGTVPPPATADYAYQAPGVAAPVVHAKTQDIDIEEEEIENEPHRIYIWIILGLLIVITGIGLIGLYKYKPELFDGIITPAVTEQPKTQKVIKKAVSDSIKQSIQKQKDIGVTPKVDSVAQSKILPPETPVDTFAVVIASFKTLNGAKRQLQTFTNNGIVDADIHKSPKNKHFQIIMGTYLNNDTANARLKYYRNRFKSPEIYIEIYPYKKQ